MKRLLRFVLITLLRKGYFSRKTTEFNEFKFIEDEIDAPTYITNYRIRLRME